MSLPPEHQLKELFEKSASVLVLVPENADGDAFGAAVGLAHFLEKEGKSVTLAGSGIAPIKERFSFLALPKNITHSISGVREFILSFNTTRNNIVSVRTERGANEYNIFITPEKGSIDPRDFSFIPAKFSFDLVVVVGAPDKESLGALSEENPDIFYEVPVVNIDHHAENDRFGQVNIVEITASSSSEIIANLLEKIDVNHIDEPVASSLLAGIVFATESFQKKNTTPSALHTSSFLMDKGANQHSIILQLFKSQPLSLLKLWGRVMAGLKWDERRELMWAYITPEDIVQSRSRVEDIPLILEKIRGHSSVGKLFMALYFESPTHIRAIIKSYGNDRLAALAKEFPGSTLRGDTLTFALLTETLSTAETSILEKLLPNEIDRSIRSS